MDDTSNVEFFQLIFKTLIPRSKKNRTKEGKKTPMMNNFTGNEIGNQCRSLSL
jgi:hypothetical protein